MGCKDFAEFATRQHRVVNDQAASQQPGFMYAPFSCGGLVMKRCRQLRFVKSKKASLDPLPRLEVIPGSKDEYFKQSLGGKRYC